MPIASHSKSRRGCNVCKKRRVKCGEERPTCENCKRRGDECSYTSTIRFKSFTYRQKEAAPRRIIWNPAYTSPQMLAELLPVECNVRLKSSGELRVAELRFMHFYLVSTCHTMSGLQDLWFAAAPKASFENPFLLDAIIATASLHWSASFPQDKTWATAMSETYFSQAIAKSTGALKDIDRPSYSLALLLVSALIAFRSLTRLGHVPTWPDHIDDEPLFEWIRLAKGCKAVYRANCDTLNRSVLMRKLYAKFPELNVDEVAFAPKYGRHLDALRDWSLEIVELSETDKNVYVDAINYTGLIQQTDLNVESPVFLSRRIVAMVSRLPARFGELLEERRPRALVILAHAFASLKPVEDELWWAKGVPDYVIGTISNIIPTEWTQLMPEV